MLGLAHQLTSHPAATVAIGLPERAVALCICTRGGPTCHERASRHLRNRTKAEQVDIANEFDDFTSHGTRTLDSDRRAAPADLDRRSGRASGTAAELSVGGFCRLARFTGGIPAEWR